MKSISQAKDLIEFVKSAEFYNKIQVTIGERTETLWYLKDDKKWIVGNESGGGEDIDEGDVESKLQSLDDNSQVLIAGNDTSGVLTYRF